MIEDHLFDHRRPADISRLITSVDIPPKDISDILRGKKRGIKKISSTEFADLEELFDWILTGVEEKTRQKVKEIVFI